MGIANKLKGGLLIISCLLLFSCDWSRTKEKNSGAQIFYNRFTVVAKSIVAPSDEFAAYFLTVIPGSVNVKNFQLDQGKIDSLKTRYDVFRTKMDTAIKKLIDLGEFDTSFTIIASAVKYIRSAQNVYASVIPTYLYVFKIGWKLAGPFEKETISNSSKVLKSAAETMRVEYREMELQLRKFMRKYKVVDL